MIQFRFSLSLSRKALTCPSQQTLLIASLAVQHEQERDEHTALSLAVGFSLMEEIVLS